MHAGWMRGLSPAGAPRQGAGHRRSGRRFSVAALARHALAALAGLLLVASAAFGQAPGPDSIVRLLYQHYIDTPEGLVFSFDYTDPTVASNYLEPSLARIIVADARNDPPRLDFDPFVGGQDFEIKSVDLETRVLAKDRAEVVAHFKNFDEEETRIFTVVATKRGWRIYDVRGAEGEQSLRELLTESS